METGQEQVVVSDQVVDQPAEGQQQAVGQPADEQYVRVPRSNYEKYAPDGDFNKVIHAAKEYQALQQAGFVSMAEQIRAAQMDGYQFLSAWNAPEQQEDDAAIQQQQQQQGQQQQGQPQPLTPEQVNQMVQRQIQESQQQQNQKQQMEAGRKSEQEWFANHLDGLGYKATPEKVTVGGNDLQATPIRDFVMLPAIQAMAQRLHQAGLNPNSPTYQQDLYAPLSQEVILQAAETLKPYLTLIQQQAVEQIADQQAGLPNDSLAGGGGGRTQKNPADMTPEERKEMAFQKAGKKLQGQY